MPGISVCVYVCVQIRMGLVSHDQLKNRAECSTEIDIVWISISTYNNENISQPFLSNWSSGLQKVSYE